MRVLATLIFVFLVVCGLGFWATWAVFDLLRDSVVRIDDTTLVVGQVGAGTLVVAGLVLSVLLLVLLVVAAFALPLALVIGFGALSIGLAIGVLSVIGSLFLALWPVLAIGAVIWWLVRRSRPRPTTTPAA